MVLEDAEISRLVEQLIPLLNGSKTEDEIVSAFSRDKRANIRVLLKVLDRRCLIERHGEPTEDPESLRSQERFFRAWSDEPEELIKRVRQARVLIVGLETNGVVAASELVSSGIAVLHIADDDQVIAGDYLSSFTANARAAGSYRRDVLAERLRETAPWCRITTSSISEAEALFREPSDSRWDLMIGTMLPEDLAGRLRWARIAHEAKLVSLFASCTGLEAHVGPLVVPGETPCWNCCRLRMLANAEHAFAAHKLQHVFTTTKRKTSPKAMPASMALLCGHLLSLEALKIVSGYAKSHLLGQLLVQNLVTLQTSLHKVIAMPWCEICGGASTMQRMNHQTSADVQASLSEWIDPRTGIVSEVTIRQLDTAKLSSLFCAHAFPARYTEGVYDDDGFEGCGGKGLTEKDAITGAVGEAIERYSAARVRLQDLRRSPLPQHAQDFLDPIQLCLYDEDQYARKGFPFRRFDPDRSHYWVKGQWLDNRETVWAPALMTYYNFPAGADDLYCQVTSNGLAAGAGLRDATLRAVMELIERDVFMMTWLCRRPARRLIVDDCLDWSMRNVIAQLEGYGANLELYLLNGDVNVPVVVCLGLGDGATWPGLTVSSAAHLSPRIAVRNALLEHAYSGLSLRQRMLKDKQATPLAPEQVRPGSFLDHALFYLPRERAANCDFLRSGSETVSLQSLKEPTEISLEECSRRLSLAGLRVAVVDVTAPDVALTPFRVVRALGVNMQPIYCGHGMQRLANPRLLDQSRGKLNQDIHPLC